MAPATLTVRTDAPTADASKQPGSARPPRAPDPAFDHFAGWLADALSCCPALPPATPATALTVAIYGGTGDGRAAVGRVGAVADALRATGALGGASAPTLHALLVDDPSATDFGALANAAAAAADASGVLSASGVSAVATLAPRALHAGAAAPPSSVHVGVSVAGLARLSSPPCGGGFYAGDPGAQDGARDAYDVRAAGDLAAFLRERAKELVPGGLLLIVVPGELGGHSALSASLSAARDAVEAAAAEGVVDASLTEAYSAPLYCWDARSLEAAASATGDWAILQRGCASLPCAADALRAGAIDAAAYGRALAEEGAALVGESLRSALGLSPAAEAGLWARAATLVAADPGKYPQRGVAAALLLQRRGGGAAARPRTAGRREWFESRRRSMDG